MSNLQLERSQAQPEETRRGRLVLWTIVILLSQFAVTLLVVLLGRAYFGELPGRPFPADRVPSFAPFVGIVVTVVFGTALVLLVRLGRTTLSALALIAAWTLITTLNAFSGGVTSFWPAFMLLPIIAAGLLIDGKASMLLAGLATVLVILLAWLEFQGLFVPRMPNATSGGSTVITIFAAGNWSGLFWSVAALTSLLTGNYKRALAESRTHARELDELREQLEERVAEQTAELLRQTHEAAVLEERTRLARDIHDTIAQGLTGTAVLLGAVQRELRIAPDDAERDLDLAQRMTRESLAEARRSVWNLRSPALQRGDLGDALRSLASHPLGPDTAIRFEQHGTTWPLRLEVEAALLRITQEALVNVAKHARATAVQIDLSYNAAGVTLAIHDDGVGFDDDALRPRQPSPWSGFGLLGMRERLAELGGSLTLSNAAGARVTAVVPRERAAPAQPEAALGDTYRVAR